MSDHDEIGVFTPPVTQVLGRERYEANDHEGHRSGVGFTDVSMYSARKFAQLAPDGRLSILVPLFAPDQAVTQTSPAGAALRSIRIAFLLVGGGGSEASGPLRPELFKQYGWDVKYGAHALRLATDVTMTLPVRSSVISVR